MTVVRTVGDTETQPLNLKGPSPSHSAASHRHRHDGATVTGSGWQLPSPGQHWQVSKVEEPPASDSESKSLRRVTGRREGS